MKQTIYDTIIIGAGAAGLVTAIFARRRGFEVLLLDGKKKIGAKILMSGGNRCNVTNRHVTERDYESQNLRFVRDTLRAFSSERAVKWFEELGVELVLEPGGKYFPVTHSAKTVLEALLQAVEREGIPLETGRKVTEVTFEVGLFHLRGDRFDLFARNVVLATGGLSHPTTGSDGTGYAIAQSFGHTLIPTTPGLTPLLCDDPVWQELSGVSLPCRLTLWVDQKKRISFEGPFLFTHFGFSGPAALNISRHWVRLGDTHRIALTADFLPALKEADFNHLWAKQVREHPAWSLKRFLSPLVPERFAGTFLKKIGVEETKILNQVRKKEREQVARSLSQFPLDVTGVYGYGKAEVTAGGVNLDQLDRKSLESKLQPGLFFAGEILDVDGRIGGFNFQWAWSSAYAAAAGLAQKIGKR